jgi:hypothetical protein
MKAQKPGPPPEKPEESRKIPENQALRMEIFLISLDNAPFS